MYLFIFNLSKRECNDPQKEKKSDMESVCERQCDSRKLMVLICSLTFLAAWQPTHSALVFSTVPLYNQLLHLTLLTSDPSL